jgi:hypothetical protein
VNPADVRAWTVAWPVDGPPPPADAEVVVARPVPTRLLGDAYTGFEKLTFDVERGCWGLGTSARGGSIELMRSGEVRCWYPASDVFVSSTLAQFYESVRAVAALYPFYDAGLFDDDAHMERLQQELFGAVSGVDPRPPPTGGGTTCSGRSSSATRASRRSPDGGWWNG